MSDNPNQNNNPSPDANGQQNPNPNGNGIPDWVSDPARAYQEIQNLRQENARRRTEFNQLSEQMQSILQRLPAQETTEPEPENPVDALNQRIESLAQTVEQERQLREQAQRNALLTRIASDFNLPAELVGRLQGSTEEELRADAKSLSGLVQQQNNQNQSDIRRNTTGVPGGDARMTTETHEQKRARYFGNSGDAIVRPRMGGMSSDGKSWTSG